MKCHFPIFYSRLESIFSSSLVTVAAFAAQMGLKCHKLLPEALRATLGLFVAGMLCLMKWQ